jgi:signal transduction histidine kinase
MDLNTDPSREIATRAQAFARDTDLSVVAGLFADRRNEILDRWLATVSAQPFHAQRGRPAMANHIAGLFDALIDVLQRNAPRWAEPIPALDDLAVLSAAQAHAAERFELGLTAAEVVAEFRLLRQEIARALRFHLREKVAITDVVGAELLINDALDGAIALALEGLTRRVEELREDVLATTVHDIRQPITTLKGNHQLALRALRRPNPELQRVGAALERAEAELDRLSVLLDGLADASRAALGRLELHRSAVDPVVLVREIVDRLAPETAARIQLDLPSAGRAIGEWDRGLLERVIRNLVDNAAKYAPADTPIELALALDDSTCHLSARDRGIGFSAAERERLFERYGRAQGAIQTGARGLGLGLYASRAIVEAHGGRIWAESPGRGQGATFHVSLPCREPD